MPDHRIQSLEGRWKASRIPALEARHGDAGNDGHFKWPERVGSGMRNATIAASKHMKLTYQ